MIAIEDMCLESRSTWMMELDTRISIYLQQYRLHRELNLDFGHPTCQGATEPQALKRCGPSTEVQVQASLSP